MKHYFQTKAVNVAVWKHWRENVIIENENTSNIGILNLMEDTYNRNKV